MMTIPRIGALALLSGCFAFSAAFRIVEPSAAALAADGDAAAATAPEGVSGDAKLLAELMQRRDSLSAREASLDRKETAVREAEAAVRAQLAELEALETRLTAIVEVASTAAEADVARLVAAYQAMDGKRAAAIFETMDVNFAAGLIARMRDEPAAAILSSLPPERAYAITVHIAGRNAAVEEN
ncbi:MAG: hypothetical protein AAFN79_09200 [Pseudomonadota bacterium]